MKMNIKTLLLVVSFVLAGSAAATAQSAAKNDTAAVTSISEKKVIQTITAKIKVVNSKNGKTITLKTNEGTFNAVVDESIPDHDDVETILRARNGKKLIISGILDKDTGTFTVVRIGGMNNSSDK